MRFLAQRHREPELMDDPRLNAVQHHAALRGLARINWFSGSSRILWPALRDLARKLAPRPLRVLDLATGSGDVPRRLWHKAQQAGVPMEIDGCDMNPQAVQYAQQCAVQKASVRFFVLDAMKDNLPTTYDVLMTSLFLHHLETAQATDFLRRLATAARAMVLVNDLCRSAGHYLLAVAATRLLSRSPVVHVDGPRSVAAAFTVPEVKQMAQEAGLRSAQLSRHWPCRFLLKWERPVSSHSTP